MYRIVVEYRGGMDLALERKIQRATGRSPEGSGFYFPTRTRDLEFAYEKLETAVSVAKKLRELSGKCGKDLSVVTDPVAEGFA